MSGEVLDLNEIWRRRVQVYWLPLTRNVRPINIMFNMRLTNENSALEEIVGLDSNGQTIKAAEKFMEFLMSVQGLSYNEVTARWSQFDQALKQVHPWLYDIVMGQCDPELQEQQKKLINFFMEEIMKDVDPDHLYSMLVSKNLMEDIDLETLKRITDQKGPTLGTVYMVSRLHRSTNQNWYHDFLEALMTNGYEELVKQVDDVEYMKLCNKYGTSSASASEVVEMSVSGDAYQEGAANYAGAPAKSSSAALTNTPTTSALRQGDDVIDSTNILLHTRNKFDDGNDSFHSSSPDTTRMTSFWGNNKGDPETNHLNAAFSNSTASVYMSLKRAVEIEINCENWPSEKKLKLKNIDVPEDATDAPVDDSNVEVDGLQRGEQDGGGEPAELEMLELRDYQQELASRALEGNNVIICAPTGSGKTHVALRIIQNHLEKQGQGVCKVMFLVNQVALAEQQYNQCHKYLTKYRCKRVTGNTCDTEKVPLKHLLMGADVMVMTAQILLDALDQKEIDGICQFSLIIFDECHHTNHKHPFNCIMHHYMSVKYDESDLATWQLPQVVGLTASVGVGKAGRQEQARTHILKLCAHLDASYICTVHRNVEQLAQFSNDPKYEQFICDKRAMDDFQEKVEDIMRCIEEKIDKSEHTAKACNSSADLGSKLKPPRTRGSVPYEGWVSQLRKEVAKVRDPDARRFLESCRRMLDFYNAALIINDACDTEDAMKYLIKKIDLTYENIGNGLVDIDISLKELFDKNKPYLDQVSKQQVNSNPKMIKLEELLVKAFQEEPTSRAMVFVKTRDLADALKQWMQRRPRLKEFNPGKVVGAGPSVESGGMTKNQQVDVIQYFRDGNHKVMVATSVAEEGLDIRKCNLVIRYEYSSNEIAMMQARGRARAENSKFVTLASNDKGVQAKEEVNFIREMMMHKAIEELQKEMEMQFVEFRRSLEQIQKEEKSQRDVELAQRKGRQKRQGDVEFRCRKCDEYACMSTDIRTIKNMHHVVMDLEFRDRHSERPHPRPQTLGDIKKRSSVVCKNCGEKWGRSILFKNTKFPVLKIEGFVLTDEFDRKDAPKRWKQTKFHVKSLEPEELEEYRKRASAVGYTEDED